MTHMMTIMMMMIIVMMMTAMTDDMIIMIVVKIIEEPACAGGGKTMMMKKFTQSVLLLVATLGLFTACGPTEIPSTPLEEAVKPVATFMNATPGVQLFSFFTSDAYKEEKVVVKGMACLTGSYGDKPAVGMCALEVDGVKIKPHFLVSQEDKEKQKNQNQTETQDEQAKENWGPPPNSARGPPP